MRQGGSVPFLITKMRQNSIDDVLVLDTRNHFDRPAAATADLNIDPNADRLKTRLSR